MKNIILRPIGVIHTPFKEPKGTPIQPGRSRGARGTIEINAEFTGGLSDLDGFSHVILLYYFHLYSGYELMVTPYLDNQPRGLFATRTPRRPNPIGLSVVKLQRIENNRLYVVNVDMVDGTPLLDIKPYVPEFSPVDDIRIGWLEGKARSGDNRLADGRFPE